MKKTADAFSGLHPLVSFLYLGLVLTLSMFINHPVCLAVSLASALAYSVYLNGRQAVRFNLVYMLPMLVAAALLNPLFNHQGRTLLAYLPDGNPLTLESIAYGLAAAVMLVTVMIWFSCFNMVITSDKLVYLFGQIIPALSLVLSMTLRFVPRFRVQLRVISNAQKCVGRDPSSGNLLRKAKHGLRILSIMVTWALENVIETADSMKSRGYGLPGRAAFSLYRFDKRDGGVLLFLLACAAYIILGSVTGGLRFQYFPSLKGAEATPYAISILAVYAALCLMPLFLNAREAIAWRILTTRADLSN